MGEVLTIRNLDKAVKRKLRIQAALHGRSMEAEARHILAHGVQRSPEKPSPTVPPPLGEGKFDHLIGIWKGRMTTDEVMKISRGD